MNILFLHRNFPAQFRYLAEHFGKDPNNKVAYITERQEGQMSGVVKVLYKTKRKIPNNAHRYLRFYEDSVIHAQAAAEAAIKLKNQGFKPDVIYGHTWGPTLFMKEIFPDVPLICYFEWYYQYENSDIDFVRKTPLNEDEKARTNIKNSHLLQDLVNCDKGISPMNWQKSQFPSIFHDKIDVMFDGVETDYFVPNPEAKLVLPESNIELTSKDEVITYATRGMEPYRGFPQFMKSVEILLKERPKAQVVIAGQDRVCYGAQRTDGKTFKQEAIEKLDLDLSRVHFSGLLPYNKYRELLQISKCHVYLTYPFVLSWSLMDAMSSGCCIVASDTEPVKEVIKDGYNGMMVDFFSVDDIVKKVIYAIDNQDKVQDLRYNARKTAVKNYALKDLLPKHIDLIQSLANKKVRT